MAPFGPVAMGQKLSRTLRKPAVSVVVVTKQRGRNVTHAYLARPMLMMIVVPSARATDASSWFAIPNIGQMVLMFPVKMKYAHATTTIVVEMIDPGIQSARPNGFHTRPPNS